MDARTEEYVRRVVAAAPPLKQTQVAKLKVILGANPVADSRTPTPFISKPAAPAGGERKWMPDFPATI